MVVGEHCQFRSSLYELSLFQNILQIWGREESSAVCGWISPFPVHGEHHHSLNTCSHSNAITFSAGMCPAGLAKVGHSPEGCGGGARKEVCLTQK